jgi:hypothetical protein
MDASTLAAHLESAMARITRVAPSAFVPTGWWVTMDARFVARTVADPPPRLVLRRDAGWTGGTAEDSVPLVRLRYHQCSQHALDPREPASGAPGGEIAAGPARGGGLMTSVAALGRRWGLGRYFEPYRPFDFQKAGDVPAGIWDAAASAGLGYVLTKSNFGRGPVVARGPGGFVAINHTAGQWDGWTPFETVNHVRDLERAEKSLLARRAPGWLLTSVDTCLWAFSGELWSRAAELRRLAQFCVAGGRSGALVPALPRTIARYADICDRLGLIPRASPAADAPMGGGKP